jgi:hypothetical protein
MVTASTVDAVAAIAETLGDEIAEGFYAFLVNGQPYDFDYTGDEIAEGMNPGARADS